MSSPLSWRAKAREALQDTGLLALRLWAGQEFLLASLTKLRGGTTAPDWFAGLDFPLPHSLLGANANWLLAGVGELVFSALLLLGIGSRWAALGLLYVTWVAIYSVHFDLGWSGWNQIDTDLGQGFKLPLMLAVMLWAIVTQGGGRYSLGRLIARAARRAPRGRAMAPCTMTR